jgi:hypothetical protein
VSTCDLDAIAIEQAVFASSDRGTVKGYQLVSRSAGVDRALAQELSRWAPTQVTTDDPDDWTINYFPLNNDSVAVTRTVLGGPEYSSRGGTQVVTLILLLRDDQFVSYSCNPMAVARTAMMMGHLRLPLNMACPQLPQATLPNRPIVEPPLSANSDSGDGGSRLLDEVTGLIKDARRVAVIGLSNPIDAVERLIPRLPVEARRSFSFTTGLSPTVRRPFQAHFLTSPSMIRQRTLDAQNIIRVDA